MRQKIWITTLLFLTLYGCSKIDPYEGYKAYYFGDHQKALEIFLQACDEGDSFSCYNLGGMFKDGLGVSKDKHVSYQYYHQACTQGIYQACNILARIHKEEKEFIDPKKVLHFYTQACTHGSSLGCYFAGVIHYNKQNSENYDAMKKFFKRACSLGEQRGCSIYQKLIDAKY